jgi:ParB family chromosome partitioning protein
MTKKKRLGRGLDALLSKPVSQSAAVTGHDADTLRQIPLELLQRGQYQPRIDMRQDTLEDLARSIKAQGVVQPIVARRIKKQGSKVQHYEIIAGERRWRASQLAGQAEIPVVIRDVDEQTAMAIGLIENIQRDDLNPLEEASALHRLLNEFELTHQDVARAVGKSRTSVTNLLRLLDLMPDVKEYVETKQLEMGHARALLGLKDGAQTGAARQVVSRGLSVRETEKLVRRLQMEAEEGPGKREPKELDPDVRRLQDDLAERLGARVKIQQGGKGKGTLVIAYNSLDELDGILEHIK